MTASSNSPEPQSARDSTQSASADTAQTDAGTHRVGVLSTHNSKETKAILNAVRVLGHEPVWIRDENVTSWIEDGTVRLSPQVDVLVNRMLLTKSDHQLEDLQLAALYGETSPVINEPQAVANTLHKFRAGAKLAADGLPVPDAFFGRSPRTFEEWPEHLPDAAAYKHTIGTNGRDMSIVSPNEPVGPMINDEHAFVQEFLEDAEDRPSDVRVYVVGGEVVGAMRRHAPEGDWRTNVALGGDVEGVTDDLGQEPRHLAKKATAVLGLDLAGVDLMPIDGDWYILEVNATAGFKGLFSATGVSAAPHIARLAIERAGGSIDTSQVVELETTLDDSVPDCKPPLVQKQGDDGVLGYTSRIRINGRDGAEQAVAKSDTGAKRTSIDTDLAGRIGAGPLVGTTDVRSGTGSDTETRPLVDVDLCLNGRWRTVTASITDRSEMTYPVLLGRDVLEAYTLDISRTIEE
ncbi:putative ATP-dependent zinc protease [Halorubrum ezzemoulense]|uniref:30S ribosomal protein S6--L-glutamate ligase n=1 Tax=Halorubrum ezzemoulense TaxID=337243 RepID=A0A256J6R6_HALEZ|nr:RimK/LysX family protein [Halorubrum ezzemoulense]OYR64062.1 30S ribosomal protein S6--L-glutamate ligase [Halorubrum ezzemoulense]